MKVQCLSEENSILTTFLSELRSIAIQNDRMRFRKNLERIGEVLCYEMSKELTYNRATIETPLGLCETNLLGEDIVICSILRAGLPLHLGVLNYFDRADSAFISAYRKHKRDSDEFEVLLEYAACPNLENKTLVIVDPMLATGQSLVLTYNALLKFGTPKKCHLISIIGAKQGVEYVDGSVPSDTNLWIGAIDQVLNDKGYIVPGLGDAGDLAYGTKLQQ